jgi:transposase
MHIHSNATTNLKQRAAIQSDSRSYHCIAAQHCVSVATIHRWKQRKEARETRDRSCRPQTIRLAFSPEEEHMVLSLREKGLALDSLLETVEVVLPKVRRASLHRLLVRHGKSRLPPRQQQETGESSAPGG